MKKIINLLTELGDNLEEEYDNEPDLETCRIIEKLFDEIDRIAYALEKEGRN